MKLSKSQRSSNSFAHDAASSDVANRSYRDVGNMNALITAIGSMSADAVIRSLRRLASVRIIGTNITPQTWIHAGQLVDIFYQVECGTDPGYRARIESICAKEDIDLVIPLTDTEVDALTHVRDDLLKAGAILAAPDRRTISIARDKLKLHDCFRDDSVVRPIPSFDASALDAASMRFPLIAKPRDGRSSEGFLRIPDCDALNYYLGLLRSKHYIIQPWIDGVVCVVDVVRNAASEKIAAMARTELLRTCNGAGLTVRMEPDSVVLDAARRVASVLELNGCFNVEFLLSESGPLLMDVNPRFSAGVAFSELGGYDMVSNHVRCFIGKDIDAEVVPPPKIYYRRYVEGAST
jgi:carbamoyl-phosphate synthase large subunit